jgi:hypothetical protein
MVENPEELKWLVENLNDLHPDATHVGIDRDGEVRQWNTPVEGDFYPNPKPPKEVRKEDVCWGEPEVVAPCNMITREEFYKAKEEV